MLGWILHMHAAPLFLYLQKHFATESSQSQVLTDLCSLQNLNFVKSDGLKET